ncbi:MAG: DUF3531 family protein [Merismopediaceae bacterium]|nr:DUF3531 family protein [Merismopediaceae bacterium]
MDVQFREFNPFDCWVWIEFENYPSPAEQAYVEELFNSWFYLGKLGAFNAENLQVQDAGVDLNYLDYDNSELETAMMAPMHNMADFQYQGVWGRCWFDLGTSDLIAVDTLLNALKQLSAEYVPIKRFIIGGINEDWPVDSKRDMRFEDFDEA